MSDNTVYFYDGEWREYSELHDDYGITLTPSVPITLYDASLNTYSGWVDSSNNDTWVVSDHRWYTQAELPYWKKTGKQFTVYLIDQPLNLDIYSLRSNELYAYNGTLQSFQVIHLGFGITLTPSEIYYVKDAVIKCWYNKDINQYWDVDTIHWYDTAPDYSEYTGLSINAVGSTGLFLYANPNRLATHYGALVDSSTLKPMHLNFPNSGELSYTVTSVTISGTWRLLTEVSYSSKEKPSIVFATKVSEDTNTTSNSSQPDSSVVETVEYSL